jgi:hypothetical protein
MIPTKKHTHFNTFGEVMPGKATGIERNQYAARMSPFFVCWFG